MLLGCLRSFRDRNDVELVTAVNFLTPTFLESVMASVTYPHICRPGGINFGTSPTIMVKNSRMRHLAKVGFLVLISIGYSTNVFSMSDCEKEKYYKYFGLAQGTTILAISSSENCWSYGWYSNTSLPSAKFNRLKKCLKQCNTSCRIVDIDATSKFIRNRGVCSSSSSASSSSYYLSKQSKNSSSTRMSDSDKQNYLDWIDEDPSLAAALALDSSGCWQPGRGRGTGPAKRQALEQCAWKCKSKTCRIVDLNGKSEFITRKDEERKRKEAERRLREQLEDKRKAEAELKRKEEERKLEEQRRKKLEKQKQYVLKNYETIPLSELAGFLQKDNTSTTLIDSYFHRSLANEIKTGLDPYEAIVNVIRLAKQAGIRISKLSKTPVQFLLIDTSKDIEQAGHEFPVSITTGSLPRALQPRTMSSSQLEEFAYPGGKLATIIFNISEAKLLREVSKHETIESEYQISTQEYPNPAYELARIEVAEKAELVREFRIRQRQCSATCYGLACFACLAFINKVSTLEKQYQSAKRDLGNTPMTVSKPIYQSYEFNRNTIAIKKNVRLDVFILDHEAGKISKRESLLEDSKDFKINYKMHKEDRSAYKHKQGTVAESAVTQFEEMEVTFSYDDLLRLSKTGSQSTNLSSVDELLTQIQQQTIENQDKRLASLENKTPRDSESRFRTVVIVLHPDGGMGSGFYINEDTILTNYHVISGTSYVEIGLYDESETFGKVIAQDIRLDLALVKVQKRGVPASMYDGNPLEAGITVDAIGHPQGLEYSLTRGTVSSVRKLPSLHDPGGKPVWLIQSDVAINPGNSGGPLFFGRKVVGVNVQKLAAMELEGLSFAVHYLEVHRFLEKNGM